MLSVVHILSGDLWAGAEVMVYNLLNKLKSSSDLKIIAIVLNEGILTNKLKEAGIETYIIPETTHSLPVIFIKAYKLLKGKRIDIVHSHRYKENLLALLLVKATGVERLVTTLHGLPETLSHGVDGRQSVGWTTKINYFFLKYFFTSVVVVSNEIKEILAKKYCFRGNKVNVIYNGIPIPSVSQPRNHSTNSTFHIGTVGRMVPVKDFELFLEVAAEVKSRVKNVRFSILGDGPRRESLIQKSKNLNIEDSVEFLSSRPDPFSYYQSLDLYLNTSLHEGIPLSILEAMACRKPVVAPKVGGIPEIIIDEKSGLLVERNNLKEFADSCVRLMEESDLRTNIANNAIKRITSHFCVSTMAASYIGLYENRIT